jgi:hypothetical protein
MDVAADKNIRAPAVAIRRGLRRFWQILIHRAVASGLSKPAGWGQTRPTQIRSANNVDLQRSLPIAVRRLAVARVNP